MLVKCISCGRIWSSKKEEVEGLRCSKCNSRNLIRLDLELGKEDKEKLLLFLIRSLKTKEITIKELVDEVISENRDLKEIKDKKEANKEKCEDYKKKYKEYRHKYGGYKGKCKELKPKVSELENRKKELEEENEHLRHENKRLKEEEQRLKGEEENLEKQVKSRAVILSQLNTKIRNLKNIRSKVRELLKLDIRKVPDSKFHKGLLLLTLRGRITKGQMESIRALSQLET